MATSTMSVFTPQMTIFRVFIKRCEDYEAVTPGLHEKVRVPKLGRYEDVSDQELEPERALQILDYLEKYRYASRNHAMFRILFRTGFGLVVYEHSI